MARKFRQLVDLYTTGIVRTLRDGQAVWVQALNPFEQDTARNEAQIAQARITLALKEFGSDEQVKVRMFFFEAGLNEARARLVDAKVAESMPRILEGIRNDPEWTERLTILERGLDDTAKPAEDTERELVDKLAAEYTSEVGKRLADERTFLVQKFGESTEDELWADYLDWYINRRASEVMLAEFRLHQMLYGVRWCSGTDHGDGTWTHENCDGHQERLFVSKEEVRSAPDGLIDTLLAAVEDLEMTVREAKNSDRQGSSSDSSPLPSGEAASTASTPTETRVEPLGTSSSPSATPSPSSAGVS